MRPPEKDVFHDKDDYVLDDFRRLGTHVIPDVENGTFILLLLLLASSSVVSIKADIAITLAVYCSFS